MLPRQLLILQSLTASELQQPMAIALIGGLITSTALTLVALPALYQLAEILNVRVNPRLAGLERLELANNQCSRNRKPGEAKTIKAQPPK